MDWQMGGYGAIVAVIVGFLGKKIVPIFIKMLDNAAATASASGNTLATVQAERDQWKKRAEDLDKTLQDFRNEWAEMKSRFVLLEYQLQESNKLNATLLQELTTYREQRK